MILDLLLPVDGGRRAIDLDGPGSDDRLISLYSPQTPEWLRLNLVASVTGSAAGQDGTSNSLTNPIDRRLLGIIRELADVVLIGAQSVRKEGYRVPRTSRLAIVTGSGDLSGNRLSGTDPERVIVLCPEAAVRAVRGSLDGAEAEIVVVEDDRGRMEPARLVEALREKGLSSIVCEGGPHLAAQLLSADLVDELCLTTGPVLTGNSLPLFGSSELPERRLRLTQLLGDRSSTLYARWSILRG